MSRRRVRDLFLSVCAFSRLTGLLSTGVFGIPLDVLVERNGADSMHGAGAGPLRVPSFVDDVISAMKQMGEPDSFSACSGIIC